ncbi:mitochondrial import receptor subunit TOM40 homolog isoform X4 [Hemitrygon akajei]|uniref:mitochondrial import receptor subunit TOM40 homolog isoform X4 n=1 Tax=Hemitrygon akajei TaxID=2704970 RepID=UPI003BFA3698
MWGPTSMLQRLYPVVGTLFHGGVKSVGGPRVRHVISFSAVDAGVMPSLLIKDVFPQQLEGVKLIINKHLSSHFQAAHTIHLSSMSPHYHFKAMYSGDQQADSNESFPQALGEVDSTGSLNAQCVALLASRIRAKAAFQTQQERFQTWQFDTEYRGDSFTATITLGNPDIISESASHWVGTLNIGRGGAHASYYHQANDQERRLHAFTLSMSLMILYTYSSCTPRIKFLALPISSYNSGARVLATFFYCHQGPFTLPASQLNTQLDHIIKFADDTTVVGLISKNDESAYREEVQQLMDWCRANNLSLNVNKTNKMVVDFRRAQSDHSPLNVNGSLVDR